MYDQNAAWALPLAPLAPLVAPSACDCGGLLGSSSFGAVRGRDVIQSVLGGAASTVAVEVLRDPYVQAQIADIQAECKTQAKVGVAEFMRENWHLFVIAGAALLAGNFVMLTMGVVPLVKRR